MANYAIMRMTKLKTMGNIGASLQHNFRERETLNADPERTPKNEHDGAQSSSETIGKLREKLPDKYRKDAVLAVEYMMTASPEWFEKASPEDQAKFFERSREWLSEKYGKDNVLLTTIHRDEKTPHMAAYVVPINDKGRLSAYSFTGKRQQLRDDQTRFAEKMQDIGLERGIEGSKAKHKSIQQFYKELEPVKSPLLNKDIFKPRVKKKVMGVPVYESKEEAIQRVNQGLSDHYTKAGLKAAQNRLDSAEFKRMKGRLEILEPKAKKLQKRANGLTNFYKRLEKMKEQGITGPDGQEFKEYVSKSVEESRQKEVAEQEKSKPFKRRERSKNKGIER